MDYTLTALGQEAAERVEALTDWIEARMWELADEPSSSERRYEIGRSRRLEAMPTVGLIRAPRK